MSDFYEPWQPQIGQRVRVRLSGECRRPQHMLSMVRYLEGIECGHFSGVDGQTGVIEDPLNISGLARDYDEQCGHRFYVRFDTKVRKWVGDAFAAIELEPLDDEAQP